MAFTPNLIQTDQIKSPNDLFNFSRDELILGVKKSKHPFHLCTFSSVHNNGPFACPVISRGIDEHLTQSRIHTDMRSQKKLCYAYPSSPDTIITNKTKECVHPEVSIQPLETCRPMARQNFSANIITLQVMGALWLSTSGHVRIQGHRIEKFVIA